MKRLCTESEKELLYKNREQMLSGIYWTASQGKYSHVFVGILLSTVVMFAGIFLADVTFHPSKSVLIAWMLGCFFVSNIIFFIIMNILRVKKEVRNFLKQKNLMINGATIVEIDEDADRFAYIEDDFQDKDGKPIIIEYPSCPRDITPDDIGKRILVMYDSDATFQLVRLNDELKGFIPDDFPAYPLAEELDAYLRVPHPNAVKTETTGHELSESEKETFADLYVKVVQGAAFKMLKTVGVVLVVSVIILCFLLNIVEGGYPLSKTLPIGILGCVGMALLYWLMSLLGKVNLKRQAMQFVYMKEVVFHSYVIKQHTAKVCVYEWEDGQIQLCEYPAGNISTDTVYGSILYKFTDKKGSCVLQNTGLVSKKRK